MKAEYYLPLIIAVLIFGLTKNILFWGLLVVLIKSCKLVYREFKSASEVKL